MQVKAGTETFEIDAAAESLPTKLSELDAVFDAFGAEFDELPWRKQARALVWVWARRRVSDLPVDAVDADLVELGEALPTPDEDGEAPKPNRAARRAKSGGPNT